MVENCLNKTSSKQTIDFKVVFKTELESSVFPFLSDLISVQFLLKLHPVSQLGSLHFPYRNTLEA